jgi:glycerol uptake facilitator-like aquaporin
MSELPVTSQRIVAEGVGSALLLATVVGSGIMAERLAGGNVAIALLGNTIATGAMLVCLILMFGRISGAHFNPVVTLFLGDKQEFSASLISSYILAQVAGALFGVLVAHAMFDVPILQMSVHERAGPAQWFSEFVATFGLVLTIIGVGRSRADAIPFAVGLYITAAYWFTASTSFANPAVTVARALTDSFSGIRLMDAPGFILAQLAGGFVAARFGRFLFR